MKLKFILMTGLLTLVSLSAERMPVRDQQKLPKEILEPWKTDHWFKYAGIYEALGVEGNASARIVLTPFTGGEDLKYLSACMIVVPDLVAEPIYKIYGSIEADVVSGKLDSASIDDWKMIRYFDPVTRDTVFGISIDGRIYVDRSKTKQTEASAGQPAIRPESKSESGDKPQPEAEERSR
jgi:hypothetical protein